MSDDLQLFVASSHDPNKKVSFTVSPKTDIAHLKAKAEKALEKPNAEAIYFESGDIISEKNISTLRDEMTVYLRYLEPLQARESLFHLAIVGPGAVGKSAITMQFISGEFVADYDPTIEDAYRKRSLVDGSNILLDILDTAGQEDFRGLREQWVREKDGLVIVFSIVQKKTFEELDQFFSLICEIYEDETERPPLILVGNKCDLDNPEVLMDNPELYRREVTIEEAEKKAKTWGCVAYVEASAKTNKNIPEVFGTLTRHVLRNEMGVGDDTCFVGSTMVEMADGSQKPMKDIEIGDVVSTFDFTRINFNTRIELSTTKEGDEACLLPQRSKTQAEVVNTSSGFNFDMFKVSFSNDTHIICTQTHPIYVQIAGDNGEEIFVKRSIKEGLFEGVGLSKGDKVMTSNGKVSEIVSIDKESFPDGVQVFDLKLQDAHPFFANGIMVGNKQPAPCAACCNIL